MQFAMRRLFLHVLLSFMPLFIGAEHVQLLAPVHLSLLDRLINERFVESDHNLLNQLHEDDVVLLSKVLGLAKSLTDHQGELDTLIENHPRVFIKMLEL